MLRPAQLVALLREPDERAAWPLTPAVARLAGAQLHAGPGYRVIYEDAQLVLLARRAAPADSAAVWQP